MWRRACVAAPASKGATSTADAANATIVISTDNGRHSARGFDALRSPPSATTPGIAILPAHNATRGRVPWQLALKCVWNYLIDGILSWRQTEKSGRIGAGGLADVNEALAAHFGHEFTHHGDEGRLVGLPSVWHGS